GGVGRLPESVGADRHGGQLCGPGRRRALRRTERPVRARLRGSARQGAPAGPPGPCAGPPGPSSRLRARCATIAHATSPATAAPISPHAQPGSPSPLSSSSDSLSLAAAAAAAAAALLPFVSVAVGVSVVVSVLVVVLITVFVCVGAVIVLVTVGEVTV